MFRYLLNKDETISFINTLYNNKVYNDKKNSNKEDIIGLFYDALFKYSIIIESNDYYDEFLKNIKYLFKKINNINDIDTGVNKLLSRLILDKIKTKDKAIFMDYIFAKYIDGGYFIHAYNNRYKEHIDTNGFNIDEYENLYDKFIKVQTILTKYNCYAVDKDFSDKSVYFTDNMKLAYYYSCRSPFYFYNMICGEEFIKNKDCFYEKNYKECLSNIKKVCYKYNVGTNDEKYIIDVFNEEWNLLNNKEVINSFILVKRSAVKHDRFSLEEFKKKYSNDDYYVIFDKLVNNNYTNLKCVDNISRDDIEFLDIKIRNEEPKKKVKEEIYLDEFDFTNSYGKVSLLLLIGSILITLGIIITILLII